jgi:hypothetical protein
VPAVSLCEKTREKCAKLIANSAVLVMLKILSSRSGWAATDRGYVEFAIVHGVGKWSDFGTFSPFGATRV